MAIDSMAERLSLLLEDGHIPASMLGPRHRLRMRSLFDARVLEFVRKGGGRRVVVRNQWALEAFIEKMYPSGLEEMADTGDPPRGMAVAYFRNAKRVARSDAEPVLLRGFGEAVLHGLQDSLQVADLTRLAGVTAIRLTDEFCWCFKGDVAVVENQEVFLHLEGLEISCNLAVYAAGRLSKRVLEWLGSKNMRQCNYIHCGDYDPVGLDEYLRLSAQCPGRVRMHLPADLETHFTRHGKTELVQDSREILARLRKSDDPSVIKVVDLIDRFGVGVEQEILLLEEC